jgi:hypothetical protein
MRSRKVGLVAAGVLALATAAGAAPAAGASAAAPLPATRQAQAVAIRSAAGTRLLYNHDNDRTDYGWWSNDYPQKSAKADDSQLANQFTVPTGRTWAVTEVVAPGFYCSVTGSSCGSGIPYRPATSESVYFYKNTVTAKKQDVPGALIKEQTLKGHENAGLFVITGITQVSLPAGQYWISVQANMPSAKAGAWVWTARAPQAGLTALWQNPGNGYSTGCTTWTDWETCSKEPGVPDFMFALYGSSNS